MRGRRILLKLHHVVEIDPALTGQAAGVGLVGGLRKLDENPVGIGGIDGVDLNVVLVVIRHGLMRDDIVIRKPDLIDSTDFDGMRGSFRWRITAAGVSDGEKECTNDGEREFGHIRL